MSPETWCAVAVAGGAGAVLRFVLDGFVASRLGRSFPFGTFVINISGAFVLGLVAGLALSGDALVIAGSATIGSYTTFSTWALETHRLREDGEFGVAVANIVVSVAVGIGAAALGRTIGGHL